MKGRIIIFQAFCEKPLYGWVREIVVVDPERFKDQQIMVLLKSVKQVVYTPTYAPCWYLLRIVWIRKYLALAHVCGVRQ
jgi:hypothetical protein